MPSTVIEIDSEWTLAAIGEVAGEPVSIDRGPAFYYAVAVEKPGSDYFRFPFHGGGTAFEAVLNPGERLWVATRARSVKAAMTRAVGGGGSSGPVSWSMVTGKPATIATIDQLLAGFNARISALESGATTPPPTSTAPAVTTQPSITGGTTVGNVLTLDEGAASGTPAPTRAIQWLRGTTAISGATGPTYTLVSGDVGQAISARVTWTNSAGSVQATSNAITGQAPAPSRTFDPNLYDIVWRKGDPGVTTAAISGTEVSPTGFKVTQLDPQGRVQVVFNEALPGKANVVYQRADGALVAGTPSATGRHLQLAAGNGWNRVVTGGVIVVADVEESSNVTQTNRFAATGPKIAINGSGSTPLYSLGSDTGVGNKTTPNALQPGARYVWYGEFDVAAGTYTIRDPVTGALTSGPLAPTTITNSTAISILQYFVGGALHGYAAVTWADGESRPISMADVLADFPSAP